MRRGAWRALAVVLMAATIQAAVAHDTRLTLIASGVVHFELTANQLIAAQACPHCRELGPRPGAGVELALGHSERPPEYTLEAYVEADVADDAFVLQARVAVKDEAGASAWNSPWITLRSAPTEILSAHHARRLAAVRIVPEYRLLTSGREPAGTHGARVTYRVRETGSSAAHDLIITVPSYLLIRAVDARGTPIDARLTFDLSRDPRAYLDAVVTGRRLHPDPGDFDRLEIVTNAPRGYRVTIDLHTIGRHSGDHALLRDRVLLRDHPAHGATFHAAAPTNGAAILFDHRDISLTLDGSEPAGSFAFLMMIRGFSDP